ncbi:MAG: hypothetical protein JO035_08010 [Betaproteobacteria bacterium]|nr:hypothetical protein [Betaproteobacteria bacterium]
MRRLDKLGTWPVIACGAAIASFALAAGRLKRHRYGSPSNASDAIDDVELHPRASPEQVLDAGVMQTFPASDPPAVAGAFETAHERKSRGEAMPDPDPHGTPNHERALRRSPDWLLDPAKA